MYRAAMSARPSLAAVVVLACFALSPTAVAQSIEYPADARIIDATDPLYGAVGNGMADDTTALNDALAAARIAGTTGKTVYLPDGVYLVSNTVAFPEARITLQGQSTSGTIIRLIDNAPGYDDPDNPKRVVSTRESGGFSANQFRVYVNDLTIETGSGNPGAVGLLLHQNNTGGSENVTIRSGDGTGVTGLNMSGSDKGPGMIRYLTVEGFDTGIAMGGTEYSMTFENITLLNQNVVGINNTWNLMQFRGLTSTNSVPVLRNNKATANDFRWGIVAIIDGVFNGGDPSNVAIENEAQLYLRNISTTGYQAVLSERGTVLPGTSIAGEYIEPRAVSLFQTPKASLGLPIQDTPTVPLDPPATWTNVETFGANPNDGLDDAAAVQAAIDSGATTVYFPGGRYDIDSTVIVRGAVYRMHFFESAIEATANLQALGDPVFDIAAGTTPTIVMQKADINAGTALGVRHTAARTLVLRNGSYSEYNGSGTGQLFVEDVVGGPWHTANGQQVWMRQINPENPVTKITNEGSDLWILGLKTEKVGTPIVTRNGGRTELIGGLIYPVNVLPLDQPMFVNDEGSFSAIIGESAFTFAGVDHRVLVDETRNGVLRRLRDREMPGRVGFGLGAQICLYSGFEDAGLPAPTGPLAYYSLNDDVAAIATDSSGNSNDGTLQNGPLAVGGGINGQALSFDGNDDFVELPTGLLGSAAGAVSVWINTSVDFTDSGMIFYATSSGDPNANGGGSQNECHLNILDDERISFFIEGGTNDIALTSANSYADGQWHHLVASWDINGFTELYIDGVRERFTRNPNYNNFDFTSRMRLGQPFAATRRFQGLMDEVRIYDRPLDHWEVMDLYFGELPFTNYAPSVDAGRDLVVQNTDYRIQLEGQTADDGQPTPTFTTQWSVVTGPGAVTFDNDTSANTEATFAIAGDYTLQLTADDSAAVVSDETTVSVFDPLPAPWLNDDVGSPAAQGWALLDQPSSTFTVNGSGNGIENFGDTMHFVYQQIDGSPIEIVARLDSFDATDNDAEAGLTWRSGLGSNNANLFLGWSPSAGLIFSNRSGSGGGSNTIFADAGITLPVWLRLRRTGTNGGEAAYSTDGTTWIDLGSGTANTGASIVPMGMLVGSGNGNIATAVFSSVDVRPVNSAPIVSAGNDVILQTDPLELQLAGSVNDDGLPADRTLTILWTQIAGPGTATFLDDADPATTVSFDIAGEYVLRLTANDGEFEVFDEITITTLPAIPSPWENTDVGGIGLPGFASFTPANSFTVTASGNRIGSSPAFGADSFHFVYQPIEATSAIEVVARIDNFDATDNDGRAGVMYRTSFSSAAANAFLGLSPNDGLVYSVRGGTNGGTSVQLVDENATPPIWVRMTRTGTNIVQGAFSQDGVNWTSLDPVTVNSGGGTRFLGLATTSGQNNDTRTAIFTNATLGAACNAPSNGSEIQAFIDCLITGVGPVDDCLCADLNRDASLNSDDVALFVATLISN